MGDRAVHITQVYRLDAVPCHSRQPQETLRLRRAAGHPGRGSICSLCSSLRPLQDFTCARDNLRQRDRGRSLVGLSLPPAFAAAASTLGLTESALAGGEYGLSVPPITLDLLAPTPVPQAVPVEQTSPPTAPAPPTPVK